MVCPPEHTSLFRLDPAVHAFVSHLSPVMSSSQQQHALQLYRQFLAAETVDQVCLHFYKLRLSLGLPTAAAGSGGRYEELRAKVLPLCHDFFVGKRMFIQLDQKARSMSRGTQGLSVSVVGAGPVGLRTAIELALLGQEVTVLEKQLPRQAARRPNVLKLWKWAFDDLHALGVHTNHMNGKGNKHIRTDTLQVELIRIALILGVNFLFGSAFVSLKPLPVEERGDLGGGKWGVSMDHQALEAAIADTHHRSYDQLSKEDFILATCGVVVQHGCDVRDFVGSPTFRSHLALCCHAVVGAGGVHDPVRARYAFDVVTTKISDAVGLVTFFKNGQTKQERAIDEVLWAKQFNVPHIKGDLEKFGGDMENLVYFQTPNLHYLVMTPTRSSLTDMGILGDGHEKRLVVKDQHLLETYARNVGRVVGLPTDCEFYNAQNPAKIFDFSERTHAAEACKVFRASDCDDTSVEGDSNYYALLFLVGDALLEPFWPEGLGVNRGFHSGFDASWSIRNWGQVPIDGLLQEREHMYTAQKNIGPTSGVLKEGSYGTDPSTRYTLQAFTPEFETPQPLRTLSLPDLTGDDRHSISLEQLKLLRVCSKMTMKDPQLSPTRSSRSTSAPQKLSSDRQEFLTSTPFTLGTEGSDRQSISLEQVKSLRCCSKRKSDSLPPPPTRAACAQQQIQAERNNDVVMSVENVECAPDCSGDDRQSISLEQVRLLRCCSKRMLEIQCTAMGNNRCEMAHSPQCKASKQKRLKRCLTAPVPMAAPISTSAQEIFLQKLLVDYMEGGTEDHSIPSLQKLKSDIREDFLQRLLAEMLDEGTLAQEDSQENLSLGTLAEVPQGDCLAKSSTSKRKLDVLVSTAASFNDDLKSKATSPVSVGMLQHKDNTPYIPKRRKGATDFASPISCVRL